MDVMSSRPATIQLAIGMLLVLATFVAYAPVAGFDFVNWDDDQYIVENPHVLGGLTAANIRWAFTTTHLGNWHPLTWLSHQLDCTLFGARPGPAHVENVIWHVLNTLLVWQLVRKRKAESGKPARRTEFTAVLVAALFALHPLHVESVAWVSERKDLLSAFFGLLAIGAYLRYVERPSLARMFIVAGLQTLSLLAKPMLVTLPALLLILDYWPLRRWSRENLRRVIVEKWPLITVSLLFSLIAVVTQRAAGALQTVEQLPIFMRVIHAAGAYLVYIEQTFWPVNLACFYPLRLDDYPLAWPVVASCLYAVALGMTTRLAWRLRHAFPCLLGGWLWYLVSLLPVIGLAQVGWQAHADRYTYLPLLGVFVPLACWLSIVATQLPRGRTIVPLASLIVVTLLALQTRRQVETWHNSETLFTHCLAVTGEQPLARFNLGLHLAGQRRFAEAETNYLGAIHLQPIYPRAHNNLGVVLKEQGREAEAIKAFQVAVDQQPDYFEARMNLGQALEARGDAAKALVHFSHAIELRPDDIPAQIALGRALANAGNATAAESRLRTALQQSPAHAEAKFYLALVVIQLGRNDEGRQLLLDAQRVSTDDPRLQELISRHLKQPP